MFALRSPVTRVMALAVIGLFLAAGQADARAGRGGGFGSRGSRTWSAPAPTRTAPQPAQPIQRSTTPQPAPGVGQTAPRPGVAQPARSGWFGNRGGFLGGLVGAGLIGMLLGYGLFGGLGGLGSILGLLLQVALVVLLVRFAIGWWQRRNQPAYAGAAPVPPLRREAAGPSYARSGAAAMPGTTRGREQVPVTQADLDLFERTLGEVQRAYGARDLAALDGLATPEVVGFLAEELGQNERRGVVNHIADVKLLQGDVAESWSEGRSEYATVAMRFSLRDWTTDTAGRVVEGDPDRPTEATELWTFLRERGGPWRLAAIQQA
ncbi:MAG: Tim44-like domain-containing protein [Geminicoccaceae bacterium]